MNEDLSPSFDVRRRGQIVRVYSQSRFTIWDLDNEVCYSCYDGISGFFIKPGVLIEFDLSESGKTAISPRVVSSDSLTEAQFKNIVITGKSDGDDPDRDWMKNSANR